MSCFPWISLKTDHESSVDGKGLKLLVIMHGSNCTAGQVPAKVIVSEFTKLGLQVLAEPVQQELVTLLVICLDSRVLQVATRREEAVDLVWPPLDDVLDLDCLLPLLHILFRLVLAGKHGVRDGDARGVVGVDHGRMRGRSGLEERVGLRGQVHNLTAPAVAQDTPCGDTAALRLDLGDDLWDALEGLGWCGLRL